MDTTGAIETTGMRRLICGGNGRMRGMVLAAAALLGVVAASGFASPAPAAEPTATPAAGAPRAEAAPVGVDPMIWRSVTTGVPAYGVDAGFWQSIRGQPSGG